MQNQNTLMLKFELTSMDCIVLQNKRLQVKLINKHILLIKINKHLPKCNQKYDE